MAEIAAVLQSFSYDHDGNLTSDGLVDYSWDGENRLIRMETSVAARSAGFPHKEITFRYDYLGRRVQKRVVDVTQGSSGKFRHFLGIETDQDPNRLGKGRVGIPSRPRPRSLGGRPACLLK